MIGGVEVSMPEPASNNCDIDASGHKMNSGGVPEGVRRDLLRRQGWDDASGGLNVLCKFEAHTRGAKRRAIAIDEQVFIIRAWLSFAQRLE